MSVRHDARFAEELLAPDYRGALNAAFEADGVLYAQQRRATQRIVIGALAASGCTDPDQLGWEMRRRAALAQMAGQDFGPFSDYFTGKGGKSEPSLLTGNDLEDGRPEAKMTNRTILSLNAQLSDPTQFLGTALDAIEVRKRRGTTNVGPENYTTSLKFFADKYRGQKRPHVDREELHELVNRSMAGLEEVARHDAPNFLELTNLLSAIRALPVGMIDEKFSPMVIEHGLKQLPNFNGQMIRTLFGAMGRLDLTNAGDPAATLFDLALRKGSIETTAHMQSVLRVMQNLPAGKAANAAFHSFLLARNNLELALDLAGLDEVNSRLVTIALHVIDNPKLKDAACKLAFRCAARAKTLYEEGETNGKNTADEIAALRVLRNRTATNFSTISAALDRAHQRGQV